MHGTHVRESNVCRSARRSATGDGTSRRPTRRGFGARGRGAGYHHGRPAGARAASRSGRWTATLLAATVFAVGFNGRAGAQAPDNPLLRWQFFYDQRAFPAAQIPVGAMQRARAQLLDRWPELLLRGGTGDGVAGFELSASTWTAVGPAPISNGSAGRIATVAVHPTDVNTIYIGGAQGGVWKTTDGGLTWTALTDGECSLAMGSIAIDPVDPDIVYAGTGELHFSADSYYGCGILRSTDAGLTWTRLGAAEFASSTGGARISRIIVDQSTAGSTTSTSVFAAASNGLWVSRNSGLSWTLALSGVVSDLQVDGKLSSVLYAAIGTPAASASNGVHRSTDSGATWTQLTGFPTSDIGRIALGASRRTNGVVYAAVQNGFGGPGPDGSLLGVWRTLDGGETWTRRAASQASCSTQCWYDLVIAVDPANDSTVWFGGVPLYRSTNGAESFQNVLRSAHVDQHAITFAPSDPTTILIGNDGGIYRSRDNAATWQSLNAGLAITQFYPGISLHPSDTTVILGGTQDNGTLESEGTDVWQSVLGADGGFTAIDFNNPTYAWAETQWSQGSGFAGPRLRIGSGNFDRMVAGINTTDRALFIPPLVMDRTDPATLYFGTFRLYRTTTRGTSWTAISGDLTTGISANGRISAIAMGESDPGTIWVGTSDGNVQLSTNGGVTWTLRNDGLPRRYITDIAVDGNDPTVAVVTVSGFGTGHVFRTTDAGLSWTDISGVLPDVPINAVLTDNALGESIYLGTDLGVFLSINAGAAWTPFMDGLPNVAIFDLVFNRSTGIAVAGTHGRSVFAFRPTAASIIAIDTDSVTLTAIGDTARLNAVALDLAGDTISGLSPVWRETDSGVAIVSGDGLVTATGNGETDIIAAFAGAADTVHAVVRQIAVDIADLPASLQLVRGEEHILVARAVDALGSIVVDAPLSFTSTENSVATVDAEGLIHAVGVGTTTIAATVAGIEETAAVSVGPPSVATIDGGDATRPAGPPLSAAGTMLSMLQLGIGVSGLEPVRVTELVFSVDGYDPGATLFLVRDDNGNGTADPDEPTVTSTPVNLRGQPVEVTLRPADLRIASNADEPFVVALQLSGDSPNGAVFQATWQPQRTAAVGTRSNALNQLVLPGSGVTSSPLGSTVLGPDDLLTFNENPVRSRRVIFNFREAPTVAAVYTVTGRLVIDLTGQIEDGARIEWDLRNSDGERVAPGVYLVIFNVAGATMRERLVLLPPRSDEGSSENGVTVPRQGTPTARHPAGSRTSPAHSAGRS